MYSLGKTNKTVNLKYLKKIKAHTFKAFLLLFCFGWDRKKISIKVK